MSVRDILRDHQDILGRFPKVRMPLSPEYQAAHANFYRAAREGEHLGASIALRLEKWMHREAMTDRRFPLLEIGAGTLNHVALEPPDGAYDVVEPMASLYAGKPELARLRYVYADAAEVPAGQRYKRIISIAVLEHVTDLPMLLARAALLLDRDAVMSAGIPSEGSLLWYLAWRFGTGTTFRLRYGLSYARFQRHEHVNDAREIEALTRLLFDSVTVTRFPLPFLQLSVYTSLQASGPRCDVAEALLAGE